MIKEDAFIAAFGIGAYLLSMKNWKHGSITTGFSVLCFLIIMFFILPPFRSQSSGTEYKFITYWNGYGSTLKEILLNFLNPVKHIEVIFTIGKLKQMFNLFSVFVFLPFFSWRAFLFLVIPNWFMLYSSNNELMNGPIIYYGMLITPFLFYSSIKGIEFCQIKWPSTRNKLIMIFASLILLVQLSNSRFFNQVFLESWKIPIRYTQTANEIVSSIPVEATVSAQLGFMPHMPLHPNRSVFPDNLDKVEFIVLDRQGNTWPLSESDYYRIVDTLHLSNYWKIQIEKNDFILFRRKFNTQ
jgi:hypothetical protein